MGVFSRLKKLKKMFSKRGKSKRNLGHSSGNAESMASLNSWVFNQDVSRSFNSQLYPSENSSDFSGNTSSSPLSTFSDPDAHSNPLVYDNKQEGLAVSHPPLSSSMSQGTQTDDATYDGEYQNNKTSIAPTLEPVSASAAPPPPPPPPPPSSDIFKTANSWTNTITQIKKNKNKGLEQGPLEQKEMKRPGPPPSYLDELQKCLEERGKIE